MYIKQVIIQGFRSYRDQTIIEPFSPQHNVIVGRNGSGKSNFFFAIQFVLSDEFSNMRQEERQALLHEGTGPRVVSAFVEIIFDNSDNRIPIDKEEVSIRRVIGSKKDQYFLDKKNVTKSDIMNLLEGAGFSRSNPYYIVKQGKITQLATAKDQERLKLLREVAGTKVYEERKEESRSILEESEGKKKKIEELLQYIEERLSTLEGEKEELKVYQELDKERRCLEYTIHDKELKETRDQLEKMDNKRMQETSASSEMHKRASLASDKIEEVSSKLREVKEKISTLKVEKQQLEEEQQDQIKQRAKMELDLKDLEESVTEDRSARDKCKKELAELKKKIDSKEKELGKLLPEYERLKKTEGDYTSRLKSCEQRRSELYAKQGRTNQFQSKEERDKWIKKEIKSLSNSLSKKESQIRAVQEDVHELRGCINDLNEKIKERNDDLEKRREQIEKENKNNGEVKKRRDDLTNRRKDLWRREAELEQSIQHTKEEYNKHRKNQNITLSKALNNGIEAVKKIVSERGIQGFYGTLIENFECPEKFYTCVEVTAGNKLFNMLVDTDKTASDIMKIFNSSKQPGEVTFMPMNKIHVKNPVTLDTPDAHPMMKKLVFDERFRKAMELVFGKTLICRNLDICTQYARSEGVNCITLDGDQVNDRGALTGGYYDSRKSRLEIQKHIWQCEEKLKKEQAELDQLKIEVENVDAQVTQALGELQKSETRKVQLKETYEKQRLDVRSMTQVKTDKEQALTSKEQSVVVLEVDLNAMRGSLESYNSELGTDLLSQLSHEDQNEVDQLNTEIQQLQESIRDTLKKRSKLEGEKNTLQNLLSKNLQRKQQELIRRVEEITVEDRAQQLDAQGEDFHSLERSISHTKNRLSEMKQEMDELTKRMKTLESDLDEWKNKERVAMESINEEAKLVEKNATKRSLLVKKKEECMQKIRELGSLPADAFEKYQGPEFKLKALWKKLKKCNDDLKKYSHVNKKALDQYISFSDQKEKLMKRKDELDKGYQAIIELMDVLEQRKHEAILFTFKQVSYNFSDVFKQLVPHGKATLVMKTDKPEQKDDSEETSESQGTSSQKSMPPVDEFTGVSIKVSFSGKSAETREMNQLSGGQKSLVALGLIFAIQKCDQAPFYLFDEIDQALDPQYRGAVADMIKRLSEKAQFITTTFRPELLEAADKFYGVKFRNKVSHIDAITKEQAKDFVEDDRHTK